MPNENFRLSGGKVVLAMESLFVSETVTVRFWTGHG